jgi:hypothetical protein
MSIVGRRELELVVLTVADLEEASGERMEEFASTLWEKGSGRESGRELETL